MKKILFIVLASGLIGFGLLFGSFFEKVKSTFSTLGSLPCIYRCDKDLELCRKTVVTKFKTQRVRDAYCNLGYKNCVEKCLHKEPRG